MSGKRAGGIQHLREPPEGTVKLPQNRRNLPIRGSQGDLHGEHSSFKKLAPALPRVRRAVMLAPFVLGPFVEGWIWGAEDFAAAGLLLGGAWVAV